MVIRKVFGYNKDAFLSTLSELDRFLNGDDNDEEYLNGNIILHFISLTIEHYLFTFVFFWGNNTFIFFHNYQVPN